MREVGVRGTALALTFMLAVVYGCGGGDGSSGPSESASSRTAEGWALFESGDDEGALVKFARAVELDDSYADAYNGLGWTYARLDSLNKSLLSFGKAISRTGTGDILTDAYAGSSPAYRDLDTRPSHFDSASVYAASALSLDDQYVFEYDDNFDWHDLHLIKAQSYFGLGDYASAYEEVTAISDRILDPDSAAFIEDLADEIEYLETVYGN